MKENNRQLIVKKEAQGCIYEEARSCPYMETGWAHFGFIMPDTSVYLAGIIPPLEGTIERAYARTVLGGERLGQAVLWLKAHSEQINKGSNAKFAELYKGHSHHQLGLFSQSATDVASLVEFVRDNEGIEVGVEALSVLERASYEGRVIKEREALIDKTKPLYDIKVGYYIYTREMLEAGIMTPAPVKNLRVVDELPDIAVPRLGWQFLWEREYNRQLSGLRAGGYKVHTKDRTPPTISWFINKPSWSGGTVVIDFPLLFPYVPASIAALAGDGSFFEVEKVGSDFNRVIQKIDQEMVKHGALQGRWST